MTAPVQSDGTFVVSTGEALGLPCGYYRVAVSPPLIETPMPGAPPPKDRLVTDADQIPAKYRHLETSGLSITVVKGDNPFDIKLLAGRATKAK